MKSKIHAYNSDKTNITRTIWNRSLKSIRQTKNQGNRYLKEMSFKNHNKN